MRGAVLSGAAVEGVECCAAIAVHDAAARRGHRSARARGRTLVTVGCAGLGTLRVLIRLRDALVLTAAVGIAERAA